MTEVAVTGGWSRAGLVELAEILDAKGALIVAELGAALPFAAARMFVIRDVPEGEPRGIHAHRVCEQFLVCVRGSVKAMIDDGNRRTVVALDRPSLGLYMPALTWGTQYDYSEDAVLVVLASHPYDPKDYVHEYEEFLGLVG
ncbi:FdtA/QdtA family cupin domain-containing protein [Microbacterium sp. STN6]|uniref:sugar 3,4-ketoisomerase n=1 Tax=Microbacterium sp. STN6 TaxID=2995588 RepID=UPI002260BDDD|nr:FdtA/QdtA family cupin domain-containing protein [Microbacterium sp. STN6]MCX7521040.1 FdtA/QdtA family cupin domain-containing protein [Microbacterium sp. STN6]